MISQTKQLCSLPSRPQGCQQYTHILWLKFEIKFNKSLVQKFLFILVILDFYLYSPTQLQPH